MSNNKTYIGKKSLTTPWGEEFPFITIHPNGTGLEKAGFETEQVDEDMAIKKAFKMLEEDDNDI